mmetsp:Transcript_69702/g.194865  ORF Transcript_69702/g.194865 Transcript_69702/m.194865 type:complete len:204 (+) Transcript_69702:60-671(+)
MAIPNLPSSRRRSKTMAKARPSALLAASMMLLAFSDHLAHGFVSNTAFHARVRTPTTTATTTTSRRVRTAGSSGRRARHGAVGGRVVVGMYGKEESAQESEAFEPIAGSDEWRLERARLEERYQDSFRRRKRVFLPYVDACLWARRMNFGSKEEWEQWIDWGEKRTPYIPSNPEKYYTSVGTWRGWDHFLGANKQDHDESFYF